MTDSGPVPMVLIADDDADDRLMIAEAFMERWRECRLTFALDGVQLMRILNREEPMHGSSNGSSACPDLILLDLNMPLMDGRKALQNLKASAAFRHIPTIVMTTSDNEDDIRLCQKAGADSYIVKPSSYSEILDIVSTLKNDWMDTVILTTKQERHD